MSGIIETAFLNVVDYFKNIHFCQYCEESSFAYFCAKFFFYNLKGLIIVLLYIQIVCLSAIFISKTYLMINPIKYRILSIHFQSIINLSIKTC